MISVAEWLAGLKTKPRTLGWIPSSVTAEITTSNSALSDWALLLAVLPRVNAGEAGAPAVDPAGNKPFRSNQVGAFVGYSR